MTNCSPLFCIECLHPGDGIFLVSAVITIEHLGGVHWCFRLRWVNNHYCVWGWCHLPWVSHLYELHISCFVFFSASQTVSPWSAELYSFLSWGSDRRCSSKTVIPCLHQIRIHSYCHLEKWNLIVSVKQKSCVSLWLHVCPWVLLPSLLFLILPLPTLPTPTSMTRNSQRSM